MVTGLLVRIGWDIETAEKAHLTGKIDDTVWVNYSTGQSRIAITFDELRAQQGERVSRELRIHGGHVLRVQGGPEQDTYRALGKLLFHYPEWFDFLSAHDGVSVISDVRAQSCRNFSPTQYHQHFHPSDAEQFTAYLERHKQSKILPRKHRRHEEPNSDQGLLT